MNETETLQNLQKTNRVLKKQLDRSISDRQRLELANRQREALLKESIRDLEESKAKLEQEIRDRHLAEAKLAEILEQTEYQSALLRNVIDSSPDWIFVKDCQFRYILANHSFANSLGKPLTEILGKTDTELGFSEAEIMNFRTHEQRVLQGETIYIPCESVTSVQESLTWIETQKIPLRESQGDLLGILGICRDITDRKHAEEALRLSMEQFQFLANSMPQIIWTASFDGKVDYYNQQMYDYSGMTFEQLQDWGWQRIVHSDELQTCIDSWIQAIATGEMLQMECRLQRFDRVFRWHLIRGLAMRDEQENVVQWIVTLTDIDDNKKAEAELRESRAIAQQQAKQLETAMQELTRTQAQIVQSEKMSSLGQLVAGVAHEINNPVNFIFGNLIHADEYSQNLLNLVKLYQNYYPDPIPEIQEFTEEIDLEFLFEDLPKLLDSMLVGAKRIQNIVRSLRNFSRMDEAEIKAVDIHEGIDSTLMILQNRLKENPNYPAIEVFKNYQPLPLVECYAGQLNQVFMNILTNAIDALEERDQNRSFQEIKAAQSQIIITTEALPSQQVRIRIADNGLGISETVLQRLFDPFFTTKPIGKGTGLGMSISYQIITEKHHGTLYCNSQLGKGAEFVIEIPLHQKS